MPYCGNCGYEVHEGDKFCTNCGHPLVSPSSDPAKRKIHYEGKVYKCPNCGEVLSSFEGVCPSCGYELRGNEAADSLQAFYRDLKNAGSPAQKDSLIRNFPIPNSKEDIMEFMIMASSNIKGEDDQDIYEAWLAKFDQAYQKALLLFKTEEDLSRIQSIHESWLETIEAEKQRKVTEIARDTLIRNIPLLAGLLLMVIAIILDRVGGNGSFIELAAYVVLIVSAATLERRGAAMTDYALGIGSGVLVILLSFLLENGSMGELGGVIILIVVAVNYFRSLKGTGPKKKKKSSSSSSSVPEDEEVKIKIPSGIVNGSVDNVHVAELLLAQAGFTNVKTVALHDLSLGIRKKPKPDTIDEITINGKSLSSFFRRTFDPDVMIVITYHSMRS